MRGSCLISLGQQEHTSLSITVHPNNFVTFVFANNRKLSKWVQFAGCSLDLMI